MATEGLFGQIGAGSLLSLLLVVGGTLAIREVDLEIHRNDLRTVQHQLENQQALLQSSDERMSVWNSLDLNLNSCFAKLEAAEEARKHRRDVEAELDSEIVRYVMLIKRTREELEQTNIPELRLEDDRKFANARISSIMPEGVGFTHSGGIIRVEAKMLPPELRELVQLGAETRLEAMRPRMAAPAAVEESRPPPQLAITPVSPTAPDPEITAAQAKAKERDELALAYEREIAVYENRLLAIRSRANGLANRQSAPGRIHSAPAQATRKDMEAREVEEKILQLQNALYQIRRSR